jgi:hypothetical protein
LVVAVLVPPVAWFFTVTVAPETTPPLASVTVPLSVPVVAWAITAIAARTRTHAKANIRVENFVKAFAVGELLISLISLLRWALG